MRKTSGAFLVLTSLMTSIALVPSASAQQVAQEAKPAPASEQGTQPGTAPRPQLRPEDMEPAVNTSAPAPAPAPAQGEPSPPQPSSASPSGSKPASPLPGAPQAAPQASAAPARDRAAPAQQQPAKAATARSGRALDRLDLETTEITGNRELPKVLYIVPWKRSDLGDLVGKPVNSLLDEVLEPVDRDVFRRENRYYRALQPDSAEAAAPAAPK